MVGHVLFGKQFTDAQMLGAMEIWKPHRYRVVRLLESDGNFTAPRRGPRSYHRIHRRR